MPHTVSARALHPALHPTRHEQTIPGSASTPNLASSMLGQLVSVPMYPPSRGLYGAYHPLSLCRQSACPVASMHRSTYPGCGYPRARTDSCNDLRKKRKPLGPLTCRAVSSAIFASTGAVGFLESGLVAKAATRCHGTAGRGAGLPCRAIHDASAVLYSAISQWPRCRRASA